MTFAYAHPSEQYVSRWLMPRSFRPAAISAIIVLHGLGITFLGTHVEPELLPAVPVDWEFAAEPLASTAEEVLEVDPPPAEAAPVNEEPTPVVEKPPTSDPAPIIAPNPEPVFTPPPEPVLEQAPEPVLEHLRDGSAPEPVVRQPETTKPADSRQPDPALMPPKPKANIAKAPLSKPVVKPAEKKPSARTYRQAAPAGQQAAGVQPAPSTISPASYGAIVASQLRSRLIYPSRASGTGAVGVTLTIGTAGRTIAVSITSSSGSSAFDAAVRQAALAVQAPPPPGGTYTARTTIRFRQQ